MKSYLLPKGLDEKVAKLHIHLRLDQIVQVSREDPFIIELLVITGTSATAGLETTTVLHSVKGSETGDERPCVMQRQALVIQRATKTAGVAQVRHTGSVADAGADDPRELWRLLVFLSPRGRF